jgi:hypothetical protein
MREETQTEVYATAGGASGPAAVRVAQTLVCDFDAPDTTLRGRDRRHRLEVYATACGASGPDGGTAVRVASVRGEQSCLSGNQRSDNGWQT